jgi:hypothetical protein
MHGWMDTDWMQQQLFPARCHNTPHRCSGAQGAWQDTDREIISRPGYPLRRKCARNERNCCCCCPTPLGNDRGAPWSCWTPQTLNACEKKLEGLSYRSQRPPTRNRLGAGVAELTNMAVWLPGPQLSIKDNAPTCALVPGCTSSRKEILLRMNLMSWRLSWTLSVPRKAITAVPPVSHATWTYTAITGNEIPPMATKLSPPKRVRLASCAWQIGFLLMAAN